MKKILLFLLLVFPLATFSQEEYSLSMFEEFTGEAAGDQASSVFLCDINNDGYDDILIGAYHNDAAGFMAGAVYIIYGQSTPFAGTINLSTANAQFTGEAAGDGAGTSLSSAGDINNDGYNDILVGARYNDDGGSNAGAVYLIYGQSTPYTGTISLADADAELTGEAAGDYIGWSVSSAGDVNNDGYDDILIGATNDDGGGSNAGAAYFIYGQSTPYTGTISLADADAKFTGEAASDGAGWSVSSVGDLNNDSYDDFLIGAFGNNSGAGAAYLIYGQSTPYTGTISLADADAEFTGEAVADNVGDVSSAGDVNQDGYDDILIAGDGVDSYAGAAYLIYGQSTPYTGTISLSDADVKFTGEAIWDYAGYVSSAGDVNNDGHDDILIGAYGANSAEVGSYAGTAYLGYLYIDADHDGLLGPSILSSGTDTNDNDHDNDGIETDIDCNDDDINVLGKVNYYQDLDNDGLGNNEVDLLSCTAITGYVTNNTDINDNDHDNDGVNTLNDCNDDDNTISEEETYYKDGDNDNRGNPDKTIDVCSYTVPTGYVANDYEKYNEDVSYALGTKKGRGIVKLYDINNVLLKHWSAFYKGGVIPRLITLD
ncbi:MAG: integrin alpha, partial [Patescibacteria group bacterium]